MLMPWIATITILLFGLAGIIRGWQMRFGSRLDLISDWECRPLPLPESLVLEFSRIYLTAGAILCGAPAFVLTGLPLVVCVLIAVLVVWYWVYRIDGIIVRASLRGN